MSLVNCNFKVYVSNPSLQKECTLLDIYNLICNQNWKSVYDIVRSNPHLLHEILPTTNKFEGKTILWMVICEWLNKSASIDQKRLQLAIDLIELDPSVDLNVKPSFNVIARGNTILEGVLSYNPCKERDQLLDYLLLCGVKTLKNFDVDINKARRRINSRFSAGWEAMKLYHEKSPFFSLPKEIHFEIALNAILSDYSKLPKDLCMTRFQEYVQQSQFESVHRLVRDFKLKEVVEILKSNPSLLRWKSIEDNIHFGDITLLGYVCLYSASYYEFAFRMMELDPTGPKEDSPDLILYAFSCEGAIRDQLLHYFLFCGVKIPGDADKFAPEWPEEINQVQSNLERVISIGREALKTDNDPQEALEAMIAVYPWIANFPEKFVLDKLQEHSPKIMIKV